MKKQRLILTALIVICILGAVACSNGKTSANTDTLEPQEAWEAVNGSFTRDGSSQYNNSVLSMMYLDNNCVLFEFRMAAGSEDQEESLETLISGVLVVNDDGTGLFESYPDAANPFTISLVPSKDGQEFTVTHTGKLEISPDGNYTFVDSGLEVSDTSAGEILGHLPTAATSLNANLGAFTVNHPEALLADWFYYVEAVFDDTGAVLAKFLIAKDLSAVFRVDDGIEPVLIFGSAQPMLDAVTYLDQEDMDEAADAEQLGEMDYQETALVAVSPEDGVVLAAGSSTRLVATLPWELPYSFSAVKSSNEAVAAIDENGVITALASGDTTITGTVAIEDGTKEFSIELSVQDQPAETEET